MCAATSAVLLSPGVGKEKCLQWIGTFYFDIMPYSIANMTLDVIWKSESVRPTYVDILLQFQFVRVSEFDFNVTCFRYNGTPDGCNTPTGYTLEFQSSINHFADDNPRVCEMQSHEFVIIQPFRLRESYRQFFKPADLSKPFELKVLVKMIEYDCAQNEACLQQNDYLFKLQDRYFNFERVLQDLAYIMHTPRFENIFTGKYIETTFMFCYFISDQCCHLGCFLSYYSDFFFGITFL